MKKFLFLLLAVAIVGLFASAAQAHHRHHGNNHHHNNGGFRFYATPVLLAPAPIVYQAPAPYYPPPAAAYGYSYGASYYSGPSYGVGVDVDYGRYGRRDFGFPGRPGYRPYYNW